MPVQPDVTLNDGVAMPQLGLGVFKVPDGEARALVGTAVDAGYRAIDTAAMYGNEAGIGAGVRDAAARGRPVFLTTKLWNDHHGTDAAFRALDGSLSRLGLPVIDLYLIHWPSPAQNLYVETWRALIAMRAEGRVRSIGVSNFAPDHLERLIGETGVVPAVNQVELHPRFQQKTLRAFHARHGIATESWAPLGRARLLDDATIVRIAGKWGKAPAQVVIRWHLQSGLIVIPKSAHPERVAANAAVFDFALDADDMAAIAALDSPDGRSGPDPARFG